MPIDNKLITLANRGNRKLHCFDNLSNKAVTTCTGCIITTLFFFLTPHPTYGHCPDLTLAVYLVPNQVPLIRTASPIPSKLASTQTPHQSSPLNSQRPTNTQVCEGVLVGRYSGVRGSVGWPLRV